MKIRSIAFFIVTFILCSQSMYAQRKCATMQIQGQQVLKDSFTNVRKQLSEVKSQKWISTHQNTLKSLTIYTIPVVVHVVYHAPAENISIAQIQSQIDILNEDYRLLNSDSLPNTHPFWQYTADTQIEFCLASRDPNGNATSGITRTYTDSVMFVDLGNEKQDSTGGKSNWDPTKYLNLWVCNLDTNNVVLGYSSFPSDLTTYPKQDGVVVNHKAFGNTGTAGLGIFSVNELGRTATHEIGHWLNLNHIWGDNICGDDLVSDTEQSKSANYGCPSFPRRAYSICGSGPDGEMYMNYMDYADDACMNMFTHGQSLRMKSAINVDRIGLLTSLGCSAPVIIPIPTSSVTPTSSSTITPTPIPPATIDIKDILIKKTFNIYPNPNNGNFSINYQMGNAEKISIQIVNLIGIKIIQWDNISGFPFQVNLSELSNGSYFVQLTNGVATLTKNVFIAK